MFTSTRMQPMLSMVAETHQPIHQATWLGKTTMFGGSVTLRSSRRVSRSFISWLETVRASAPSGKETSSVWACSMFLCQNPTS